MNKLNQTKSPVLSFQHTMLPLSASDFLDLGLLHAGFDENRNERTCDATKLSDPTTWWRRPYTSKPTWRAHKVAATKIRSKDDRFEKHTDFFFPDGIKCSFKHFNVAAKLKARYRILEVPISNDTGSKLPLKQLVSFHMWKLIIIGEVKQLEKLEISSDEDNLTEAHNCMSRMVIGKK